MESEWPETLELTFRVNPIGGRRIGLLCIELPDDIPEETAHKIVRGMARRRPRIIVERGNPKKVAYSFEDNYKSDYTQIDPTQTPPEHIRHIIYHREEDSSFS